MELLLWLLVPVGYIAGTLIADALDALWDLVRPGDSLPARPPQGLQIGSPVLSMASAPWQLPEQSLVREKVCLVKGCDGPTHEPRAWSGMLLTRYHWH
ncbi:hypothetical protein [Streptomyces sp. cmx-4-9]|uniref:hypothetical protein n=1 Tax=Streptomyces sp. cmx-4-9 TaxID=2790941 RepID=UPI0039813971